MRLNQDFSRKARASVVFLLWALSLAAADAPPAGLSHFAQVDEHVYRGGQPGEVGVRSLARMGVKAVIDLRGGGERSTAEQKEVEALGMKYYSVPLPALGAPTAAMATTTGSAPRMRFLIWPPFPRGS